MLANYCIRSIFKSDVLVKHNLHIPMRCKAKWESGVRKRIISIEKERENYLLPVEKPPPRYRNRNFRKNIEYKAFSLRLQESLPDVVINQVFTDPSFLSQDANTENTKEALSGDHDTSNAQLSRVGEKFAFFCIEDFLKHWFPSLPDEPLHHCVSWLLSQQTLNKTASHIGIKDLLLTSDFEPSERALIRCLLAYIGAIVLESGPERAGSFVRDFILTHMIGRDVLNIWNPSNPAEYLQKALSDRDMGLAESRLIRQSGVGTIAPVVVVGIFSNKRCIGEAGGISVDEAEFEALKVALRSMWNIKFQQLDCNDGAVDCRAVWEDNEGADFNHVHCLDDPELELSL